MPSPARHVERFRSGVEEIREALEQFRGESTDVLASWWDDPLGYSRELGRDPTDYQAEILRATLTNKYTAVRGCHGAGKDWTIGTLAAFLALVRGMLVLIISATERQTMGQTMREARSAVSAAARRFGLAVEIFRGSIRIGGEDRIIGLTGGASVDALVGWHDPRGVAVLISEGQGERLEDTAYDAAIACAADELSRVVVVGNPIRSYGRFFEIFRREHWQRFAIPASITPNVKAGRIVAPGFPAPEWPEEVAREYGRDSLYYVGRVLAEFPDGSGEEALLRRSWLDQAADRHEDPEWCRASIERSPLPVLGVDVGYYGPDSSVCAIRRGDVLQRFVHWRGLDTQASARKVYEIARGESIEPKTWNGARRAHGLEPVRTGMIVPDVIGVGAGVVDALRAMDMPVRPFNAAHRQSGKFLNDRAAAFWQIRERLERGEIALPRDEKLIEELLSLDWKPAAGDGSIQLCPKADVKARIGRSPDRADATAMAFMYEAKPAATVKTISIM